MDLNFDLGDSGGVNEKFKGMNEQKGFAPESEFEKAIGTGMGGR